MNPVFFEAGRGYDENVTCVLEGIEELLTEERGV